MKVRIERRRWLHERTLRLQSESRLLAGQTDREESIDVKNLMQQRYFSVVTFAEDPTSKDEADCVYPQMPNMGFLQRLRITFVSDQQPAASLVSLVARFSSHLNTLQEHCDMQSAPCLKGDKIPLKIWPRWSMPINSGKAYHAQKVPRHAEEGWMKLRLLEGHRPYYLLQGEEFMPNLTLALCIDKTWLFQGIHLNDSIWFL